jgi:hypothetical protein
MSDILEKILAVKADEVAAARKKRDLPSLRAEAESLRTKPAWPRAASSARCATRSPPATPA